MKTSYKWLQDYVDLTWSPEELADGLTMAGLEVEGIETIGDLPETIVVAEIKERAKHPNADNLSLCQVDDGSGDLVRIVCGAPNCDAGQKTVLARLGTTIGDFKIKKAKIRGEESFGMMCSQKELGLSEEADGIMILPDNAPVGAPLREYIGIDTVIDWEITPNRPDWLSHIGVAREIGALTNAELRLPDVELTSVGGDINDHIEVIVEDADLCPRYTARYIRNVKIGPSPMWMQDYLNALGLRPINNVVDITNFVLHECGQPLHAFDYDKIRGQKIIIRRAGNGEKMQTLDRQEHELTPENLLIADAEGGIALAGVMGGGNSEISDATTNVLLESAAFYAPNIRKTSKILGLSTDSSYRFERGVDLNMVEFASARAAQLMCEYADGELVDGFIDVSAGPYKAHEVTARYARINSLIGIAVPPETVKQLMTGLGLEIVKDEVDALTLGVPSWRLDLEREVDLIEEIARLHGFDKIPAKIPGGQVGGPIESDDYLPQQQLIDAFLGLGLDECVHIAPISQAQAVASTGVGESELVNITNPLSQDYGVMRPSLLPSMIATVGGNIAHGNEDFRLFELGRTYRKTADTFEEALECCIAISGRKHPERFSAEFEEVYDFYDLSGLLYDFFEAVKLSKPEIASTTDVSLADGAAAVMTLDGVVVATLGQATPELTQDMRIRHPLWLARVQLGPILDKLGAARTYRGMSQFPSTARDVAFVADESLQHNDVLGVVDKCNVKILEKVHLFDIFRDEEKVGKGKKSMAYSLTFRSPKRTLKDKEVNRAHENIKAQLVKQLGVEIR